MSIFKDFKVNIVINIIYEYNINPLSPLFLTFANLLTNVCYAV